MHILIVGGGFAGLLSSIKLAHAGHQVTLAERSNALGGRGRSPVIAGMRANLGPHAIYKAGPAFAALTATLGELPGGVPPQSGAFLDEHGLTPMPFGPVSLLRSRAVKGGRLSVASLMTRLPRLNASDHAGESAREFLGRYLASPALDAILALVRLTTYCAEPGRVDAAVAIRQLQWALLGVHYPANGWESLVDRLEKTARGLGVNIKTGTAVDRLTLQGGVGTTFEGKHQHFDAALLATSPEAARRLTDDASPLLARAAGQMEPTRLACLDVVLRDDFKVSPWFVLGVHDPVYLSDHSSVTDFGDGRVVHLTRYLRAGEDRDPDQIRRELEALLDQVAPGWPEACLGSRFLPRMTVAHSSPFVGAPTVPTALPDLANVWVCGDWVGESGALLDRAVDTALTACDEIIDLAHKSEMQAAE